MRVAVVHGTNQGFFPRFYKALYASILNSGYECRLFSNKSRKNQTTRLQNQVFWGGALNWKIHFGLYKLFGVQDFFSFFSTISLIMKLKKYGPDIIHFNVVNEWIINFPLLVKYINKRGIKVVWTMHDCRAFTGRCAYFDEINCDKWKNGCGKCPEKRLYWPTWIDNSALQWKFRAKWFNEIENLTIITPSYWLANFVKNSFFRTRHVEVIYNGVDTTSFAARSFLNVREKYHIPPPKTIILGCAISWSSRKGLFYFRNLANLLPSKYQIVLVGDMAKDDKIALECDGVLCVGRTTTFEEMRAWYQEASVFVNPTLADNFPTTNIEALASGTPVVTFNTGGSPEAIDEYTGRVVAQGDVNGLLNAVVELCNQNRAKLREMCLARSKLFSLDQYNEYVALYKKLLL